MRYVIVVLGFAAAMILAFRAQDASAPAPPQAPRDSYARNGARNDGTQDLATRPNLVLIVVDTLRRDALALSGERGGAMPNLRRLADKGVAFRNAYAPSSWTPPSMASMLSGLLPRDHKCTGTMFDSLSPLVVTYAEILRNTYGFETVAFSDSPWIPNAKDSILQGFHYGVVGFRQIGPGRLPGGYSLTDSKLVIDSWLEDRDPDRPFAMLLHTYDAHEPYGEANHRVRATSSREEIHAYHEALRAKDVAGYTSVHDRARAFYTDRIARQVLAKSDPNYLLDMQYYSRGGYRENPDEALAEYLRSCYADGCRWVDREIERTLDVLRAHGLLENTLVVVTSDHGEAFGEHDTLGHGHHLHGELARIPMVFHGPARSPDPRSSTNPSA